MKTSKGKTHLRTDIQLHEGEGNKAMIDKISTSLKLAVVMSLTLACAGQQNPQTVYSDPAVDQASSNVSPDVVSHSFDSASEIGAARTMLASASGSGGGVASADQTQPANQKPSTQADSTTPNSVPSGFQERHPRYLLRPGDVFALNFEYSPEFNQIVTVQPDGFITLREAGDIYVQGLTTQQLNLAVRTGYTKILHEPSIAIVPQNFEQPYFVVGGEVKSPGKFDLRGTTTVAEAVALAGGFTEAAKHSHVLLFRRESPDTPIIVHTLNVKRMLNREDLTEDAQLRPGDMIYVPQNMLSKLKGFVVPRASIGPTFHPKP